MTEQRHIILESLTTTNNKCPNWKQIEKGTAEEAFDYTPCCELPIEEKEFPKSDTSPGNSLFC